MYIVILKLHRGFSGPGIICNLTIKIFGSKTTVIFEDRMPENTNMMF